MLSNVKKQRKFKGRRNYDVLFTCCLTKGSSSVATNAVATLLPRSRSAPREKSVARTTTSEQHRRFEHEYYDNISEHHRRFEAGII